MSNIDKQALRTAAENATPGEWCTDDYHGVIADAGLNANYYIASCSGPDNRSNKRFIAAANPATVLALLDELEAKDKQIDDLKATAAHSNAGWTEAHGQEARAEAAEKRIAELEARAVKPVAWMRNANVTSFMSRFTTDEKYAVEQWGDDAVALYPIPVAFIPACFTDERNLMHINERGRETSLIWSKQNSDSGDIKLFRIAAAAGKGEAS